MKRFKRLFSPVFLFMIPALILCVTGFAVFITQEIQTPSSPTMISIPLDPTRVKSESEWKKILTAQQYHILREADTEVPFTGSLLHTSKKGTYLSPGCNLPLFRSEDKFDSGTGWPSFTKPITQDAVILKKDYSLGIERVEVLDLCGGHLGHVFDDGPLPGGKRYCINSTALTFIEDN